MKIVNCPINGARPVSEFICGGEVRLMPNPQITDDDSWADYVFNRNGQAGVKKEWWCHTPSNTWFIADRNTQTDEILRTYLFNQEADV